jgi:hypothetical protein
MVNLKAVRNTLANLMINQELTGISIVCASYAAEADCLFSMDDARLRAAKPLINDRTFILFVRREMQVPRHVECTWRPKYLKPFAVCKLAAGIYGALPSCCSSVRTCSNPYSNRKVEMVLAG